MKWILLLVVKSAFGVIVDQGIFSHLTVQIGEDVQQPTQCQVFFGHLEELLGETARQFFELTQRRGWLKSVDVVLPRNWDLEKCYLTDKKVTERRVPTRDKTDIIIHGSRHHTFGTIPWAQQFGECGQKGAKLHLPFTFLDNLRGNLRRKSSILLKSFCKYQFGVFEEEGFLHDSLYPLTFADGNRTVSNRGCQVGDNVTLMHEFCPLGQVYDRYAPTKQNLLCAGSSAYDVILSHADFQSYASGTPAYQAYKHKPIGVRKSFRNPDFDYFVAKKSRYVLVLDRSSKMSQLNRWENLHRAITEFMAVIPAESELSIITFSKTAVMHLPPTVVTDGNRNGIIGRLPRRTASDDQACLFCAFNVTFKALQDFKGQIQPATVIFVTGTQERPDNLEILDKVFEKAMIQFFSVSYPGQEAFPEMAQLSRRNGRHFSVHDGPSDLYTSTSLSQILNDIMSNVEHETFSSIHIQLYEDWKVTGNFVIEEAMDSGFWITLLLTDTDQIEFFELQSPSGHTKMFPTFMDGFVQFYMKPGTYESGTWTYRATFYQDLEIPPKIIVKVVALESQESALSLEAFPGFSFYDDPERPPKLYAKITSGGKPVLRANVIAIISSPDAKIPTKLQLEDNGNGLVDLTQNDGIYSAIFPYVGQVAGFYSVQVIADDNEQQAALPQSPQSILMSPQCCGSRLEVKQTIPSPVFRRFASGGSFFVNYTISRDVDMIPPSRIIDFRRRRNAGLASASSSSKFDSAEYVSFEWTSPGNDFVFGKASRYKLECQGASEEIAYEDAELPPPDVYGTRQSVTLQIPITNQILLCSIRAFDEASNKGPESNVVSLFIYKPLLLTTTLTSTTTTEVSTTTSGSFPSFLDILTPESTNGDPFNAAFGSNSLVISGRNNFVTQQKRQRPLIADDVQYNSKTLEQLTVITDKVNTKDRRGQDKYTEETKIQIYAMTGIVSCMLLVVLFASTYVMVQKRKDRQNSALKRPNDLDLNVDKANDPWNRGTMVRSNIWFDTLHKKNNGESFVNPMLTSFHSIVEEVETAEAKSVDGSQHFQSTTEKTSLDSFDSIDDDDPPYENFPLPRKANGGILVQRSKSMQQLAKPSRRKSIVSSEGDIHMRQPSLRFQSTAARKSDRGTLKRSMTFSSSHCEAGGRKFVPHQAPLRHSNSRISEIIRQYNESQYQKSNNGKRMDQVVDPEPLIAPPAVKGNSNDSPMNNEEPQDEASPSFLDEDWTLQKTLERRKRNEGMEKKATIRTTREHEAFGECDKGSPEIIVQNDTKISKVLAHYDFPNIPARPAIPPRAPRGTMSKRPSALL